ncbi:hypothetical protein [Lelliottia nimipressuralis]|jgi:hypothetical protein|uniref:hypothetical protein n=1 Tax=Lelliottia nimipressuralis TaxID=69220 RepID=UPI0013E92272|nr:hypothetical protein [Lelliottia nimipressuralis]
MNDLELVAAVRVAGRYEVVTREDGSHVVIPIPQDAILTTAEMHQQCMEFFRNPDN